MFVSFNRLELLKYLKTCSVSQLRLALTANKLVSFVTFFNISATKVI